MIGSTAPKKVETMMHKDFKKTSDLLHKYHPSSPKEEVYKEKMLELLDSSEECFLRASKVGHFTGSAFLLNKTKTHALLMHHRKLDRWLQLGGHCDGDSDVLNVAIKEAQEESGIQDIKPISSEIFRS